MLRLRFRSWETKGVGAEVCLRIGLWEFSPRKTTRGAGGLQGPASLFPRLRLWRFVPVGFDKLTLFTSITFSIRAGVNLYNKYIMTQASNHLKQTDWVSSQLLADHITYYIKLLITAHPPTAPNTMASNIPLPSHVSVK